MINPIQLARNTEKEALIGMLMEQDHQLLKEICKKYTPDSRNLAYKWKNKNRLVDYIIERSYLLAAKGEVFVKNN